MITDRHGQKMTPKHVAQDMIMDGLAMTRGYWGEKHDEQYEKMTEREREQVTEQLQKQGDRIARMFGFDESWSA
jgi:hypothetical protein